MSKSHVPSRPNEYATQARFFGKSVSQYAVGTRPGLVLLTMLAFAAGQPRGPGTSSRITTVMHFGQSLESKLCSIGGAGAEGDFGTLTHWPPPLPLPRHGRPSIDGAPATSSTATRALAPVMTKKFEAPPCRTDRYVLRFASPPPAPPPTPDTGNRKLVDSQAHTRQRKRHTYLRHTRTHTHTPRALRTESPWDARREM